MIQPLPFFIVILVMIWLVIETLAGISSKHEANLLNVAKTKQTKKTPRKKEKAN